MEQIWLKYGVLGAVIIGMGIIIRILWTKLQDIEKRHESERLKWLEEHKSERKEVLDSHKTERKEWLDTIDKQFEKIETRDKEQSNLLKDFKYLLRIDKKKPGNKTGE